LFFHANFGVELYSERKETKEKSFQKDTKIMLQPSSLNIFFVIFFSKMVPKLFLYLLPSSSKCRDYQQSIPKIIK
jgi:hypothetical protein